jgi:cytochrome c553
MGRDRSKHDPELPTPVPLRKNQGRPPDPNRSCPVEIRTCPRHGATEFAYYSAGPQRGRRWKCKRCVGEAVTRRLQKVKRILVEEAGGCCCVCGYNRCIINLHFHHVDPRKKSFSLTVAMGKSLAALRDEAKKCVLACANCHGEIEAGVIECPPLGAMYATWGAVGRGQQRRAA